MVHLLLKSGQCQPRSGALQTPLHIAAKHGQVECLRLLIQYGYAVDTKGMSGTCLHEASLYGKLEVVRFLLEAGADVMALNGQGLTPLEVVNQYTDPRSSQELKRALQGEPRPCVVMLPLRLVHVQFHSSAALAPHRAYKLAAMTIWHCVMLSNGSWQLWLEASSGLGAAWV